MGLFDAWQFDPQTFRPGGGLLDQIMQMQQTAQAPGAPQGVTPGAGASQFPLTAIATPDYGQAANVVGSLGPMAVPTFGQPDQAALPQNAQPAQYQQPQPSQSQAQSQESPGIGDRLLAGLQGFTNAGGPLQAIGDMVGGFANGSAPQNQTAQFLQKKLGLDAGTTQTIMRDPVLLRAVVTQAVTKPQVRAMSPQEKQAMGLPGDLPWFTGGADGKPFLPEGLAQAKNEIKDVNGQLIAVNPFTNQGAPVAGIGAPKPKFDDITSVRKEVGSQPEVKRYGEAVPIFRSMVKSKDIDTSAADLDFVYGVAKIFDPESVVREGEMKLVGKAQSLPEDVKSFMGAVALGQGRLTPEARTRILEVAQTRMTELRGAYDTRVSPYADIAKRNNMNPADIMPTLPDMPEFKATPPKAVQQSTNGLPRMQSVQDAMKLKPGTRFIDANGVERVR